MVLAVLLGFLCACAPAPTASAATCRVVLEEGTGFTAAQSVQTVERGADAVFTLTAEEGFRVSGTDYPDYALTWNSDGALTLTVRGVRYSTVVTVETTRQTRHILCLPNGGEGEPLSLWDPGTHLRCNTPASVPFTRAGFTLVGWSTRPDGGGVQVGLGSRIRLEGEETLLYARWVPWTPEEAFTWRCEGNGAVITGYSGRGEVLCVPAALDGLAVTGLASGAFAGAQCRQVILPPGLRRVEEGAFTGCSLEELTLFDDITWITDYAFSGCERLTTLHLNAVEAPVYSGGYFDTFQDKFDRLLALSGERKLVLFSGSSTRFGYDSVQLEEAFPEYAVVNMGVFAYTNALPQLLLILDCMLPGDVLLHSPEFDAAQRQFCTRTTLDDSFFAMMESNYDTLARLDLRRVDNVFTALNEYLSIKSGMAPKDYALSPADFDEEGRAVSVPSYNEYGDYCLYRPDADSDEPVYGLPVDYTVDAFPREQFIDPLNAVYQEFLDRGITVLFTYAPRNSQAISPESTPQARRALDAWLREGLIVPVISDLEQSLYPGRLLSGTDNHLSTAGVELRTRRIIDDLRRALEGGA